ncbi:uncharacterized protein AMSG_08466 [Thecamonas trahens ATCC 50062]|uniref:B30.2/SPRY domain-containing protein n=1 Tax=Thecamonas trahens ATCC 50062 TaxID=461836 RepID=A0A0L0DMJ3_THETB|nr:hypothetical protein AMSG_08466 [Thecamonas trahens ATCC 50062]KNC52603.1 hypothetical protein AMSG_08466 [Thecamonas trahens ATCC 50062]|eukprot:XP_013755162.1 hypothetical protein AMSG_08466 [Thecamonas trahens ATCC 50062]
MPWLAPAPVLPDWVYHARGQEPPGDDVGTREALDVEDETDGDDGDGAGDGAGGRSSGRAAHPGAAPTFGPEDVALIDELLLSDLVDDRIAAMRVLVYYCIQPSSYMRAIEALHTYLPKLPKITEMLGSDLAVLDVVMHALVHNAPLHAYVIVLVCTLIQTVPNCAECLVQLRLVEDVLVPEMDDFDPTNQVHQLVLVVFAAVAGLNETARRLGDDMEVVMAALYTALSASHDQGRLPATALQCLAKLSASADGAQLVAGFLPSMLNRLRPVFTSTVSEMIDQLLKVVVSAARIDRAAVAANLGRQVFDLLLPLLDVSANPQGLRGQAFVRWTLALLIELSPLPDEVFDPEATDVAHEVLGAIASVLNERRVTAGLPRRPLRLTPRSSSGRAGPSSDAPPPLEESGSVNATDAAATFADRLGHCSLLLEALARVLDPDEPFSTPEAREAALEFVASGTASGRLFAQAALESSLLPAVIALLRRGEAAERSPRAAPHAVLALLPGLLAPLAGAPGARAVAAVESAGVVPAVIDLLRATHRTVASPQDLLPLNKSRSGLILSHGYLVLDVLSRWKCLADAMTAADLPALLLAVGNLNVPAGLKLLGRLCLGNDNESHPLLAAHVIGPTARSLAANLTEPSSSDDAVASANSLAVAQLLALAFFPRLRRIICTSAETGDMRRALVRASWAFGHSSLLAVNVQTLLCTVCLGMAEAIRDGHDVADDPLLAERAASGLSHDTTAGLLTWLIGVGAPSVRVAHADQVHGAVAAVTRALRFGNIGGSIRLALMAVVEPAVVVALAARAESPRRSRPDTVVPLTASMCVFADGLTAVNPGMMTLQTCRGSRAVTSGRWYYEVELLTGDESAEASVHIGWISTSATLGIDEGIGQDVNELSFGFGTWGARMLGGARPGAYGRQARVGDIVGVVLDLDERWAGFSLNGEYLGEAFERLPLLRRPYAPAVSLRMGEGVRFNFGDSAAGFAYPPPIPAAALGSRLQPGLQPRTDAIRAVDTMPQASELADAYYLEATLVSDVADGTERSAGDAHAGLSWTTEDVRVTWTWDDSLVVEAGSVTSQARFGYRRKHGRPRRQRRDRPGLWRCRRGRGGER